MKKADSLLLILTDIVTARLYFETGIVKLLAERSPLRLIVMIYSVNFDLVALAERFKGITFVNYFEVLNSTRLTKLQKALVLIDQWLDKYFGHIPISIRFSMIHKFSDERFAKGHKNLYYNPDRAGPLPKWKISLNLMRRWYFSFWRYIHPAIPVFLKSENVRAIVFSNCQSGYTHSLAFAGRNLGIKMVGGVASWDHPVGKGIVPPLFKGYLVQNRKMKDQLIEFHDIPSELINITGWPQMDMYKNSNSKPEYERLMQSWGFDFKKPCVLMAGHSVINAPYEPLAFQRIIDWRDKTGGNFSVVVRPHPKDLKWRERYKNIIGRDGVHIQPDTISEMNELVALLQNISCVVCTAGTMMLDCIANDLPVVGLMYDEQNPTDKQYAIKNYYPYHYRAIMDSNAFYHAESYEQAIAGIEKALLNPDELKEERARLRELLIGEMDGKRTSAVVNAMLEPVPGKSSQGSFFANDNAHESR